MYFDIIGIRNRLLKNISISDINHNNYYNNDYNDNYDDNDDYNYKEIRNKIFKYKMQSSFQKMGIKYNLYNTKTVNATDILNNMIV